MIIKKIHEKNQVLYPLRLKNGFSLVELMVAVALGVFLVLGVTNILFSGQQSFNATNRIARVQENGQLAKNMIVNDLKRARFMGVNTTLKDDDSGPLGTLENAATVSSTCNDDANDTTWGRMIEQGLFGVDDTSIDDNGLPYACIANINNNNPGNYVRGDILTIRYASPQEVININNFTANPNRLYIRNSLSPSASWIFTGQQQNSADGSSHQITSDHELIAFSYYIGSSERTDCSGNGEIPSLFRVRLDANGEPMTEELFPGIEDFQVQFSVDGANYVDSDDAILDSDNDGDGSPDWNNVVATQIWLLARSECEEAGFTDNDGTRQMPTGVTLPAPGDGYRRQLYTSIVGNRN